MIKPSIISPTDEVTTLGEIFSTRLADKQNTWYPAIQLITWGITTRIAKNRVPSRSRWANLGAGFGMMVVGLGSEWGHNLAHTYVANKIGKPVDVIRVLWGMPMLIYHDINDQTVSPKQHIVRALGGPIFNLALLPIAILLRQGTRPNSIAREIANAAVWANAFIPAVGLLPIPGIDGGPILKWSLVEQGQTKEEADLTVRKVNGVMGVLFSLAGIFTMKKRRWVLGGFFASLAALTISIATGIFKEQA